MIKNSLKHLISILFLISMCTQPLLANADFKFLFNPNLNYFYNINTLLYKQKDNNIFNKTFIYKKNKLENFNSLAFLQQNFPLFDKTRDNVLLIVNESIKSLLNLKFYSSTIVLNFSNFKRFKFKIPITNTLSLWWKGNLKGIKTPESSVGLSFKNRYNFHPSSI